MLAARLATLRLKLAIRPSADIVIVLPEQFDSVLILHPLRSLLLARQLLRPGASDEVGLEAGGARHAPPDGELASSLDIAHVLFHLRHQILNSFVVID